MSEDRPAEQRLARTIAFAMAAILAGGVTIALGMLVAWLLVGLYGVLFG